RTPKNVAPYVSDIKNEYLTGRYAPFTRSAAMVGYLLQGDISEVPNHIEKSLGVKLKPYAIFASSFSHHYSQHNRRLTNPDWASGPFECHHLVMPMWSARGLGPPLV